MAYAVSYPGGVFGIIGAILLLRRIFRIDPVAEAQELEQQLRVRSPALEKLNVRVTNGNLEGIRLADVPAMDVLGVVVSRVLRGAEEFIGSPDFRLASGDVLLAVGQPDKLQLLLNIVGECALVDVSEIPSPIQVRWITVSQKKVMGCSVGDLAFNERFGVQFTRIRRADVELPVIHDVRLAMGDEIRIVGLTESVAQVAHEMGDSPRKLGEPDLMPIFIGIAIGVLVGSIPLTLPGMPGTLKLGLAGGPLLVAILLGRRQRIGPIVWYLPRSANLLLKDLGIAVFLASVGLKSGDLFVDAFVHGSGLWWLAAGGVITFLPLFVVGLVARLLVGEHFLSVVGMLAGSMTDPPALAFANSLAQSEIPSVSYATVYPLAMILRVITAQLLMLYWTG